MSGRRAKQRRRMVLMAEAGDVAAQRWVRGRMTRSEFDRASRRATFARERQAT